jgi:DNA-binding LacI/PurR family transcriptional regulator
LGSTQTIAVSLASPRNIRNAELTSALHQEILGHGYTPIFAFHERHDQQQRALDFLLAQNPDGLITVEPNIVPDQIGLPVIGYYYYDERFDLFQLDLRETMKTILSYLQSLGHRTLGYLGLPGDERFRHLSELAGEFGFRFPRRWQVFDTQSYLVFDGASLVDRLFAQSGSELPTALLVHNDSTAFAVVRRLHELGYSVPSDFSVVGHENIEGAATFIPSLTTVGYLSPQDLAKQMVETLLARKVTPDMPLRRIKLEPELIVRESCASPSGQPIAL